MPCHEWRYYLWQGRRQKQHTRLLYIADCRRTMGSTGEFKHIGRYTYLKKIRIVGRKIVETRNYVTIFLLKWDIL